MVGMGAVVVLVEMSPCAVMGLFSLLKVVRVPHLMELRVLGVIRGAIPGAKAEPVAVAVVVVVLEATLVVALVGEAIPEAALEPIKVAVAVAVA
jgi:hypothetical protein